MTERLLQHRDGTIHGWNEWLAQEPGMVEVTEEQAYPERFVKGGKRTAKVNMATTLPAEPQADSNILAGEQLAKKDSQ